MRETMGNECTGLMCLCLVIHMQRWEDPGVQSTRAREAIEKGVTMKAVTGHRFSSPHLIPDHCKNPSDSLLLVSTPYNLFKSLQPTPVQFNTTILIPVALLPSDPCSSGPWKEKRSPFLGIFFSLGTAALPQ